MIYLLSDLHGGESMAGINEYLNVSQDGDLLIILGDIGLAFENTQENQRFTEFFLSIKKNIAFIDGNHENFQYINGFPEDDWNGGKVHRLTEHIVHMQRGNVFTIAGKTFFAFGGCKSSPKWKEQGLWYSGEEASEQEMALAYENLKKNKYQVDYILTHKYEEKPFRGTPSQSLAELTEFIEKNVQYKKWYAGHWHTTAKVDEKHMLIYDSLISLSE